jgi:hypothetical protein
LGRLRRNRHFGSDFRLVLQVKLRKRLDVKRKAERVVDGVPGLIVANCMTGWLG